MPFSFINPALLFGGLAASLPVMAKQSGAYVVEINPEDTPITHLMDEFLQGPSGEFLPAIIEQLKKAQE